MAKKTFISLSTLALLALTACGGSSQEASQPSASATTSSSATASPSPTPSVTTATPTPSETTAEPTPTVVEETPTEEASPEPTEAPSEEVTEEPSPEPSIDPYSQGTVVAEGGITFFVPEGYNLDPKVSQPNVFARQYTHLKTADDAAGRLMVGTPFTNDSSKSVEELEKQLVEDLKTAWNIQEVVKTRSYYRADGTQVIRTEVRFSSTVNPGYVFTINNGGQIMYAGLLVDQGDAIFVDRIEASLGITAY